MGFNITLEQKSLRFFATGANPEFALTNVIRDAQLQFIATSERSSFLPIFAGQLSSDIKAVVKDSILRKGIILMTSLKMEG